MMEVLAPDDYTFTFKYAEPKPLLIYTMGRQGVATPAHYMKQWIPDTADDLFTINQARNCLVHRNGVVSDQDCNAVDGLEVKWIKLEIFVARGDENRTLTIGSDVHSGEKIGVRFAKTTRLFHRGDRVTFTAQEFVEICLAILLFGKDLTQRLNAYGEARGVRKKDDDSTSSPEPSPIP